MAESKVEVSAGDVAIARSLKAGASNGTFLKALWSIRGELIVTLPGFPFPVAVVKSSMVNVLKALPADDPSGLQLVPAPTGGYEVRAAGSVKTPRSKGSSKAPAAPVAAEAIGEPAPVE